MQTEHNRLAGRIEALKHSLALADAIAAGKALGKTKRTVIRQLHFTDLRHSVGEERAESNPHVDRRRKRAMRIRLESRHGQRVMRQRSRDIYEGEQDTERILAQNDIAYDFDFDASIAGANELDSAPLEGAVREEQHNG